MEGKLSRKDKIRLLNALKAGEMSIDALNYSKVYFFIHTSKNEGIYILEGKEYSYLEYKILCSKLSLSYHKPVIWNEFKTY